MRFSFNYDHNIMTTLEKQGSGWGLGRYLRRMASSNHRIIAFDGERVTFRWRD